MSRSSAMLAPRMEVRRKTLKHIKKTWPLYLFILPSLLYVLVFNYIPLYGIQLAFKNFLPALGIWQSPWVGFSHFQRFFTSYQFWTLLKNTLVLSLYSLLISFPFPILLALMINYATNGKLGKFTQTITYAPHFISTVVLVGMIQVFFSTEGPINQLLALLGQQDSIMFLADQGLFKHLYVLSGVWKQTGWSSIIYIATLASVSPELHEAAIVDGATKMDRMLHIDLPTIMPTAIIMLIMSVGQIMNLGFEKAFLMQNSINLDVSEIISTYVYKVGLQNAQYSYSTAIGLFNNFVNFIMLITVNKLSKWLSGSSLW